MMKTDNMYINLNFTVDAVVVCSFLTRGDFIFFFSKIGHVNKFVRSIYTSLDT